MIDITRIKKVKQKENMSFLLDVTPSIKDSLWKFLDVQQRQMNFL